MKNGRSITYYDNSMIEVGIHIRTRINEYATLIPSQTLQVIQDVLEYGASRGKCGFETGELTVHECLAHASDHIRKYLDGNIDEDHLAHALTRLFMAVAIDRGHVDREELNFSEVPA